MVIQTDKIRVKIDEKEQREIFSKFAKKFKNKKNAAEFLNISKYNFHDYSHCRTRYVPLKIMNKIVQELKIKNLKIIDKKSLKQIRQGFIEKATIAFKKKYGDNWKKVLNENSKKGLYKKYGNYAYKKITQKGHKSSEAKYGKEWRKILSKKGIKSLKKKYGNNWYEIILSRGREKLRKKYGKQWQKELSKLAMESLRKKYVKNFERKHSNIKKIFQNRKPTKSEKLIAGFLKKNNIPFETNVIKENLEFDIVIPNKNNPECVIEVSSAKPTTYNQRMKILKLHYQKVIFPNAQHIAILRSKYSKKGKKYSLHKIIKSFLDKENITLLSLENINKYIKQLIECIKKNKKVDIKEKFSFNKKAIA
ncbi:MAG: hypothetical protein KKA79_10060, partial [Nanoarchaeota archaeon]|nr:hypothetical protein [Nanoarchaeota archaeon]